MGAQGSGADDERLVEVVYDLPDDPEQTKSSKRHVSTGLVALGAVVGLFALWLVSGLGAGDARPGGVADEVAEPELIVPPTPPAPTPTPVPTPTPSAVDEFLAARAANTARSQLASVGPGLTVVYTAVGGIGVLDFATGGAVTLDPYDLTQAPSAAEDARAVGFGPDDLGLLARAATGDLVATTTTPGQVAVADGKGTIFLQEPGLDPEPLEVPDGATLTAIDTFGVVAFVEGQGTFVPALGGMTLLTVGEVLTGNDMAWVERRCDRGCQVVLVDRVTLDEQVLPDAFAADDSRYLVSPNAKLILRVSEGGAGELYLPGSGDLLWVNGAGINQAAWAPDSSFVAWIDDTAEPILKLMLPDRHDWILVELGLLDAAKPIVGEIRVLGAA